MSDLFDEELKRIKKIYEMTFRSSNILSAKVGTTGEEGGDWGHGGRTYFGLENQSSTAWRVRIDGQVFEPDKIEILLGGDCEMDTFIDALTESAKKLKLEVLKKEFVDINKRISELANCPDWDEEKR